MNGYDEPRAVAFRERALDALRGLPSVMAVSTASRLPLAPDINMEGVLVPGTHAPEYEGVPIDAVSRRRRLLHRRRRADRQRPRLY